MLWFGWSTIVIVLLKWGSSLKMGKSNNRFGDRAQYSFEDISLIKLMSSGILIQCVVQNGANSFCAHANRKFKPIEGSAIFINILQSRYVLYIGNTIDYICLYINIIQLIHE